MCIHQLVLSIQISDVFVYSTSHMQQQSTTTNNHHTTNPVLRTATIPCNWNTYRVLNNTCGGMWALIKDQHMWQDIMTVITYLWMFIARYFVCCFDSESLGADIFYINISEYILYYYINVESMFYSEL